MLYPPFRLVKAKSPERVASVKGITWTHNPSLVAFGQSGADGAVVVNASVSNVVVRSYEYCSAPVVVSGGVDELSAHAARDRPASIAAIDRFIVILSVCNATRARQLVCQSR